MPSAWTAIIPSDGEGPRATRRRRRRPAAVWPPGRASRRAIGRKRPCYQACGQLRLHAAQKFNDRHKLLDPDEFPVPVGGRFSDVRMGRGGEPLERGAPSVHFGARRGHREAHGRSGALPREVVRPGAERHRTRLGLDSYSPPRRAVEGVRRARLQRRGSAARASASCSTRSSTARRRTAASRWGSTGW